ncbi:LacI family DNA-binding transcriptional regulator [Patulibacter defluvii]|uniref:LacI family DNA-binding transcriptional regulator n=1 Tax=Patulibacter defluvii TaxID=3095358 RepID=UPI002A75FCE8|nr:LacI family DNA-binding transcriptional regulator [Patulibacter sp. DM4]
MTIRDVAAAAGVSPATVSLALNGRGTISAATAAQVAAIAEQLGYRPSRTARALRTRRANTLAIVLSPLETATVGDGVTSIEYPMRVLHAAVLAATAADQRLLVSPPLRTTEDLVELDGIIVCDPPAGDPQLALVAAAGLPVVTVERDPARPDDRWHVNCDNGAAMRALLDHLAAAGAERIALVAWEWDVAWTTESVDAYRAWSAERGRAAAVHYTADARRAHGTAREHVATLLAARERPDAIVAMPDHYPAAIVQAARESGLDVPADLLVAAAMDGTAARTSDPPVTAIDLRPGDVGAAAVALLLRRIEGDQEAGPTILESTLRPRASTRR